MAEKGFETVYQGVQSLGKLLRGWCSWDDASYLWAATDSTCLLWPGRIWPSDQVSEDGTFLFIGREAAQGLYERILRLGRGRITVMGAKGSGKTFLVHAVCNHIQQSGLKRCVFLDPARFVHSPFRTLWESLLLAYYGQASETDTIRQMRDLDELVYWCIQWTGLVFVVDNWESFEADEQDSEQLKSAKEIARGRIEELVDKKILVQVSSVNSRERLALETNQKRKLCLEMNKLMVDGPFTADELATWKGLSSLPESAKRSASLIFLTGGMPRLLQYFAMAHGDEANYTTLIADAITSKLWSDFIGVLESEEELHAALRLITQGRMQGVIAGKIKFTCFYKDHDDKYRILSPFLEKEARRFLRIRHAMTAAQPSALKIEVWVHVVLLEVVQKQHLPINSARVGWNVEGLLIDVMTHQGRVFQGLHQTSFKHVVQYPHGKEMDTCTSLTPEELEEGVLLVPEAFNEKAVDVLWVKLVDGVLKLFALQITVAKWKLRSKKRSHEVWRREVAPVWKRALGEVEESYYYIMPETIKEADIPNDEDGDDEDRVVAFQKLGDVHSLLRPLDARLSLVDPAAGHVPRMFRCRADGCNSHSSKENYFCCRHVPYCAATKCRREDTGSGRAVSDPFQETQTHERWREMALYDNQMILKNF